MKLYEKSPEELIIQQEDMAELVQKATDKGEWFKIVFFPNGGLDIWIARHQGASIRSLAMSYHMSRRHIWEKLREVENRLEHLRQLFS